jgi:hypothetical protein
MSDALLEIRVLGGLTVARGGSVVPLPPSKKTRALLAYLVLTGRPHLRERLCDLLWDGPSDPRAELRWSLSRLRPLVDEGAVRRIEANHERVWFEPRGTRVDLTALRLLLEPDPMGAPLEAARASLARVWRPVRQFQIHGDFEHAAATIPQPFTITAPRETGAAPTASSSTSCGPFSPPAARTRSSRRTSDSSDHPRSAACGAVHERLAGPRANEAVPLSARGERAGVHRGDADDQAMPRGSRGRRPAARRLDQSARSAARGLVRAARRAGASAVSSVARTTIIVAAA